MYYTGCKVISFQETDCYRIHGRTVADETGLLLSWACSGVEIRFSGGRLEVSFGDYTDAEQPVYVKAFYDGKTQRFCLCGKSPKILLDFEEEGEHSVKILRISSDDWYLTFQRFRIYGKNPEILAPVPEKRRRLEFLGDSITAGFGVWAPASEPNYYTYEEDSTMTYAYMTAQLLDAEIRTEAISGQRVCPDPENEKRVHFSKMFGQVLRRRDGYCHASWIPDAVVLSCGANDGPELSSETMYRESAILLDQVRGAYPNARILWLYGILNDHHHDCLRRLIEERRKNGDQRVHYLRVEEISREAQEMGSAGHPNINASVRVANVLAGTLNVLLEEDGK